MHWGPSKVIIHHQKVIISPQKCALIPQNRSFNHISLTFSLTKMSYALLSKNVASRIYELLLAKFAKVPGWGGGGGGVNPILAMPGFGVHMDPKPTPKRNSFVLYQLTFGPFTVNYAIVLGLPAFPLIWRRHWFWFHLAPHGEACCSIDSHI